MVIIKDIGTVCDKIAILPVPFSFTNGILKFYPL
jgi:hypothetical protein